MAVLSRVNFTGQQRLDLQDLLAMESFSAFDLRTIISVFSGVDKAYIIRGFQVVGKTGLNVQVSVANSIVFNPQDSVGGLYTGLSDDADLSVDLPADQTNVFVEATFKSVTKNPVNRGVWDPLALTGEDVSGTEFSSAINFESQIELNIAVNTVGFSDGAIPLMRAQTSASAIVDMQDCRGLLYRLGTGGTTPDPLNKYSWSATRAEPVPSGVGVGDAADSPWREKDASGSINDKAFKSFKEWADAIMTRFSELSGSSIWYLSGASSSPIPGTSINQIYFDTLGHNLQPSSTSAFKWKEVSGTYRLAGEGIVATNGITGQIHSGLIRWKSNNSNLEWQLGGSFAVGTKRNYSTSGIRFTSPAPVDGGNVFLKLEREVAKGSGADVKWSDNSSYLSFTANKAVSGNAGDFTGIAIGDFIRKESEGYGRYYRVTKMWDGSTLFDVANDADQNLIATAAVIALEVENLIDPTLGIVGGTSTEPLRFFRSRYSDADLFADTAANTYLYQHVDYYWLGRRQGTIFYLRNYGTMDQGEEVTALDATFSKGNGGGGSGLVLEHAYDSVYDGTTGYALKGGATTTLMTIRRLKTDNSIETPTPGSDNTNALLTYTINAPIGLMAVGDQLWVRLSDTTGGVLSSGSVTNSTDNLDNTDTTTNKWEIRPAATTPARTFDDKGVFLLARRVTIGGNAALLFSDGSVLDSYGKYINNHLEIQGDLKLTGRSAKSSLFIHDTIAGQVDTDVSNYFYDKTLGISGIRTFRIADDSITLAAAADVSFLPNMGNKTLTVGGANSTTYFPGDLVVAGNTVAAQVSQIQSEDKLITLGVGDAINGGYNAGLEVADDTQTGTLFDTSNGSPNVIVTFAVAPTYAVADVIGISATLGLGGITAGEIGGEYIIVAGAPATAGEAQVSGSTLILRTAVAATSTASSAVTPPRSFKSEWAFKVTGADGNLTGYTSWMFQVKNQATKPTLTPFAAYGTVPTAHSVNMLSTRIPFVNDDNVGPSGADSTLNFTNNFTWDNATNTLNVIGTYSLTGSMVPGVDDLYDIGTSPLQWRMLYLGPSNDSGITWGGDTNLYRPSANLLKTDDSLEVGGVAYFDTHTDWTQLAVIPSAPATNHTAIWADDDGLVYQRTSDGDVKLLTNQEGNVYNEMVTVESVPVGNNQMAPLLSPPTSVTIPKDTRKIVGLSLSASVTNTFATVVVTKIAHGLSNGDLVTIVTSTAIGGISAVDLSQTGTACTVLTPNTFSYVAGASATSTASGSLDLVTAVAIRYFRVGDRTLEVYLNGELMNIGEDYTEVGTINANSNIISVLRTLELTDKITYRIDSNGGQYIVNANGGTTLQAAYAAGPIVNIVTGTPITLNGTGKLLVINGDMTVTGVIDPSGITFTSSLSDPLLATDYGFWRDSSDHLIWKRGASSAIDVSHGFIRKDGNALGTPTANISFGGFQINSLADGTLAQDAVTKFQLDAVVTALSDYLPRDGTLAMTANLPMGNFKIVNLAVPTLSNDAATKGYVDSYDRYTGIYVTLTNNTGSTIAPGSLVIVSTATAGEMVLADATTLSLSEGTVGVVVENTLDTTQGKVQLIGKATVTGGPFTIGKRVFLSETGGLGTSTPPTIIGSTVFVIGWATSTTEVVINPYLDSINDNVYEEVIAIVTGIPANDNELQTPVSIGTNITLPFDSRDSNTVQQYRVGDGLLQIWLNGQFLTLGIDWTEVGSIGTLSSTIQTQVALSNPDELVFRISTQDTAYFPGGGGGATLQTAYNSGPTITTTISNPVVINGPLGTQLDVLGDINVGGLIL